MTSSSKITNPYNESLALISKINFEPNMCECARVGSRALANGYMPLARYLTTFSGYFDRKNLQLEHQQIIFEASGDNIGLMGKDGKPQLFEEDLSKQSYHFEPGQCLDGTIMRKAIVSSGVPAIYEWLGYNCQTYVEQIKEKYVSLLDSLARP